MTLEEIKDGMWVYVSGVHYYTFPDIPLTEDEIEKNKIERPNYNPEQAVFRADARPAKFIKPRIDISSSYTRAYFYDDFYLEFKGKPRLFYSVYPKRFGSIQFNVFNTSMIYKDLNTLRLKQWDEYKNSDYKNVSLRNDLKEWIEEHPEIVLKTLK